MKVSTYPDAGRFLARTERALESNEAANSLMLGICRHLVRHSQQIKTDPCLATVEDERGLVLAAVMTPPYKLVVSGHRGDLARAIRLLVDDLIGDGWRVPGVLGPKEVARQVAGRWAEVTGRGFRLEREQKVYELRQVLVPVPERGSLRPAGLADLELVTRWRHAFHTEIFGAADPDESRRAARSRIERGDMYLWEDGRPVSIAMKTRPTAQGISVSLVYTPPAWRRRGYATACVGELSRMLLEAGWAFCALFADVSNATSNRLYERIGYRPVCDYDEYLFEKGTTSRPADRTPGNLRRYGATPYRVAVVHGGPGAGGEMAPVARQLAPGRGVLEPIQTATSLPGQVAELRAVLEEHADLPVTLIGFSWGAWLSVLVAAHHPALVGKLILVGSGPFEERYVARLQEARLSRLGEGERAEFEAILSALADPATADKDGLLARLGALTSQTDAYDPIADGSFESDLVACQGDIFQRVWQQAADLRRSGALLELAQRIECPLVAIHGDHDPHPAEGVQTPLSAVVQDFRFVLLERCGHKPWIERQARDAFYTRLEEELPGPLETSRTNEEGGTTMTGERVTPAADGERWRRAPELPGDVFRALHKPNRAINPITIVATVDPDGAPRTAPFGSLRAVTPGLLRLACNRTHDTYANLCRDGCVSVALLAPPNIAVSIRGRARVVREGMAAGEHLAVVDIDVDEVKNDMMRRGVIESAVGFAPPEDLRPYYVGAIAEIEDLAPPRENG